MNPETTTPKEMGTLEKIVSIFISPTETFKSLDRKPDWIVPFVIVLILTLGMQYLTLDIQINDRLAMMEAQGGMSDEQLQAASAQMRGPMRYIGLITTPFAIPVVWVVLAGLLLLAANLTLGAEAEVKFRKVFSMVAWSSLVSSLAIILLTALMLMKGTSLGVTTDPTPLLPAQPLGEPKTLTHRLLSKLDIFTIWQLILWTLGLSVFYRVAPQKAAIPVLSLWIIWIVVSVVAGGFLGKFGM